MSWGRFHPTERAALVIFSLLFASTFVEGWLYRQFWILGFGALALLWFAAILAALVYTTVAIRDPALTGDARTRAVAAVPAALALVLFSKFGLDLGSRAEASGYLLIHSSEMRRAQERAGPMRPASINFLQGIPDGGEAIIRWNGDPTQLAQTDQVKLTGERIKRCSRIVPDAWLCGYD